MRASFFAQLPYNSELNGEPFTEPTGQPMLFGGKERTATPDYRFGPRNLMSAALLWDAPDKLAGQFRQLSPYTYCAGNPVFFADQTGRKIELVSSISAEGILAYLRELNNLTDDNVGIQVSVDENGNKKYQIYLTRTNKVKRHTGTNLIRKLVDSEKTLQLDFNNSSGQKLAPGISDNSNWHNWTINTKTKIETYCVNISLDPRIQEYTFTKDGDYELTDCPLFISLGHELIHGLHRMEGTYRKGNTYESHKGTYGRYVDSEEYQTIGLPEDETPFTENKLREENGLPRRAKYLVPK